MDFSKEGCRFYIFTRWKLGLKATEIRSEQLKVFPETAPSLETVSRWIRTFADGSTDLNDGARSGRPQSSLTEDTIARARNLIEEDPTVTLRFLSLELGVSYGSCYNNITLTRSFPKSYNNAPILPRLVLDRASFSITTTRLPTKPSSRNNTWSRRGSLSCLIPPTLLTCLLYTSPSPRDA